MKKSDWTAAAVLSGLLAASSYAADYSMNLDGSKVFELWADPGENTATFSVPDFGKTKYYRFTVEGEHTSTSSVRKSIGDFSGVKVIQRFKEHLVTVTRHQGMSGQKIVVTFKNTSNKAEKITITAKVSQDSSFETVKLRMPTDNDNANSSDDESSGLRALFDSADEYEYDYDDIDTKELDKIRALLEQGKSQSQVSVKAIAKRINDMKELESYVHVKRDIEHIRKKLASFKDSEKREDYNIILLKALELDQTMDAHMIDIAQIASQRKYETAVKQYEQQLLTYIGKLTLLKKSIEELKQ